MFKKRLFILLTALITLFPISASQNVWNGTFHVTDQSALKKNVVHLDGYWEFYPDQLFHSLAVEDTYNHKIDFVYAPGSWRSLLPFGDDTRLTNIGTYRMVISGLKPKTAYGIFSRSSPLTASNFFANSEFLQSYGVVDRDVSEYYPERSPVFLKIVSNEDGEIELVVQVANYIDADYGIFQPILFGEYGVITETYYKSFAWYGFILGSVLFLLVVNLVFWLVGKNNRLNFYFTVMLSTILFYVLTGNLNIVSMLTDKIPYSIIEVFRYSILWLSSGVFTVIYMKEIKFAEKHPKVDIILSFVFFMEGLVLCCLPLRALEYYVIVLVVSNLFLCFYSAYRIYFAIKNDEKKFIAFYIFCIIVSIPLEMDLTFPNYLESQMMDYSYFGLMALSLFDIIYMGSVHHKMVVKYTRTNEMFRKLNRIFRRFVSTDFMMLLNKTKHDNVNLSDYAETEAAIMYVRLTIVSPDGTNVNENAEFEAVHFYFGQICDVITKNNGFIGKYVSYGCIILFRNGVNDALMAADQIRKLITKINVRRAEEYYPCVAISSGIHYGKVVVASTGDESHMEMIVMSEAVNVANRISSIAREIGTSFLVSDYGIQHVNGPIARNVKSVGDLKLRRKQMTFSLYELADEKADEPEMLEELDDVDSKIEELEEIAKNSQRYAENLKASHL